VKRVVVVVNNFHLREPVQDETVQAARAGVQQVVEAGALAARVLEVGRDTERSVGEVIASAG
jgi:hypothetical protein